MKKMFTKQKAHISKIPYSKSSIYKIGLDLSIPGTKKVQSKIKNDSINKDTVEGSSIATQTLALNQDSLNNTKLTISKNHSLGKLDNKLFLFTSSLKYSLNNKRNKSSNLLKNIQKKTEEECSENISSSDEDIISLGNNNMYTEDEEDTNKIDYRYYPKIPEIESNKDNNNPYYWLATYDKLMKKSKIIKILNYYTDSLSHKESEIFVIEDANSNYKEEELKERTKKINEKYNFKEKTMIIQGYEIYFMKKHGKPFIRQRKGGKLFIKLYLLNLEQLNQIFSYLNRLEYKQYIIKNNLNTFKERNTFKIINNFNKSIYNYSTIFCLGTFMNTNIYSFSHIPKNVENNDNDFYYYSFSDLPSANKIAKIIKALMTNFPDFSKQYFIDYLMKPKEKNFYLDSHDAELLQQKMGEVNSLLMTNSKKECKPNISSTNNIIKNIIKGIPTYTPSSFNTSNDLNSITKSRNTDALNIFEKNTKTNFISNNNINTNNTNNYFNELKCSDFLSNIKNELDGITSPLNQKKNNEYKETIIKPLNKIKLNNTSYTRNNNNNFLNSNFNTNKSSFKPIYSLKGINNNQNICKTISLVNPAKKSLTRNNSNNYIHYNKSKKIKSKNNSYNNINQKNNDSLIQNKENNSSILNNNFISEYNTENRNKLNNKKQKINNIFIKTDSRISFKVTRNKNNIYSPFCTNNNTNTNSSNKDFCSKKSRKTKVKKPGRVLSSVRKVINQKMNNLSPNNTNSIFKIYKNDSSSSFKNNRYINNNLNNNFNSSKYSKVVCKTNNNSQNKISEKSDYITPLKKKYFYYYQ